MESLSRSQPKARRFPALSVPHFRAYAATSLLAMAADNIEHVIGYWVIWELTSSPFWLGYAVVAHWLPFTLFSFHSGSLADRIDSRRLLHISQGLYILANLGWGFLYLMGQLQVWHIAVLLLIHGFAGLLFVPSSMLIIHEMVGEENLLSAVSLNAALRPLATTIGPAIGGFLMTTVGPGWGFFINILMYVPLSVAILFLPHRRAPFKKRREEGWSSILEGLGVVRQSPTIVAMLVILAATSFLLGNAFHALIPAFAQRLGVSEMGYSMLLSATGLGAIFGGFLLGWIGTTRLRPVMVTAGALVWSVFLILFAVSTVYMLSLALLFMVGTTQVIFVSMSQSIVQSWAPQDARGRVLGVYNFAAHGTRVLSGFFIGSLASLLGPSNALLILAAFMGIVILGISTAIRALWQLEMKGERLQERTASTAVAGS